jgi:2-oxoglutarate dehydrogenase E1 component
MGGKISGKSNKENKVGIFILTIEEMKEKAEERGVENAAFIRVEQLYPLPEQQLEAVLKSYKNVRQIIWAQEEPENMGAWQYMDSNLRNYNLIRISNRAAAAPAAGSSSLHKRRLAELFDRLFEQIASK